MYKKIIKLKIIAVIFLCAIFFVAGQAEASFLKDSVKNGINQDTGIVADSGGYDINSSNALVLIQIVINIFLSVIGVLLLIYIVYAGYNWMTAQGEEEKVEKAKDTIKRAIIGVIIIVAAYAISYFVMSRLEAGTLREGGGSGGVGGYVIQ